MTRASGYILTLCMLAAAVGCQHDKPQPPYAEKAQLGYYLRSSESVLSLKRVVMLELPSDNCTVPVAQSTTLAIYQALQSKQLFQIDVVSADDPDCRELPFKSRGPYSLSELRAIRDALKCDAVLVGQIRSFQVPPRMQMGLYLQLIDLQDGRAVWGINNIWDTTDKDVEGRIKHYFAQEVRSGYEPTKWKLTMVSPRFFQKFIAYEITQTLPDRNGCLPLAKPPSMVEKIKDAVKE